MKRRWNTQGAIVFGTVFAGLVLLVALDKLPPTSVLTVVAWLVPSPIRKPEPTPEEP